MLRMRQTAHCEHSKNGAVGDASRFNITRLTLRTNIVSLTLKTMGDRSDRTDQINERTTNNERVTGMLWITCNQESSRRMRKNLRTDLQSFTQVCKGEAIRERITTLGIFINPTLVPLGV